MSTPRNPSTKFRQAIQEAREQFPHLWEESRRYVIPDNYREVLPRVIEEFRKNHMNTPIADQLIESLIHFRSPRSGEERKRHHQILKEFTGLPPSKAVRALIVWGLSQGAGQQPVDPGQLSLFRLQTLLQKSANPYDLLFQMSSPSLLDIGAGNLSFEQELVDYYQKNRSPHTPPLVLHAFDRLNPASKVGGVYHRNRDSERSLKDLPPETLQFRFWGDMDLEGFTREKQALPHYTMATCHAPANPTFAYEPSRLEADLIMRHLRSSRGEFGRGRLDGEPVLEVSHRGRILTFPHWKFETLGPLRLLEFISRRAAVGVLSAVDDEVFWETLSQLLADDRYRPLNRILDPEVRREVFGDLYDRLTHLRSGERLDLSSVVQLRKDFPQRQLSNANAAKPGKLGHVEVRRGAVLPGVPSSFTARQFREMHEESEPWWMIMIWDHSVT